MKEYRVGYTVRRSSLGGGANQDGAPSVNVFQYHDTVFAEDCSVSLAGVLVFKNGRQTIMAYKTWDMVVLIGDKQEAGNGNK